MFTTALLKAAYFKKGFEDKKELRIGSGWEIMD